MYTNSLLLALFALSVGAAPTEKEACDPQDSSPACLENQVPVIGVLSQLWDRKNPLTSRAYIAASYVKWVQEEGAKVIPVFINQTDEYYDRILKSTTGMIFTGGGSSLTNSDYQRAGKVLYAKIQGLHSKGIHYPLWGTCLGFELITVLDAKYNLTSCAGTKYVNMNTVFTNDMKNSKIFANAPENVTRILSTENVNAHVHVKCISALDFTRVGLSQRFTVLATQKDSKGKTFVDMFESKTSPIYASIWHPEKNMFEWNEEYNFNHTANAQYTGQWFAKFFLNEAKKNVLQQYDESLLIDQYKPVRPANQAFDYVYYFSRQQMGIPSK